MAKAVLLSELVQWVENNKHRTWHREDENGNFIHGLKRSGEVKYFTFQLDTRDMRVYHVTADGFEVTSASEGEEFEGTVLELLEKKLDEAYERWEEK